MFDKFHEECGIVGVYGHREAANLTYLGLYALQHRGQEASGILSSDGAKFYQEKGVGLVSDIYTKDRLKRLHGHMAIGHNRYSTSGKEADIKNTQPLTVNYALGTLGVAHNGNLTNASFLRDELEAYGAIFQSTTDTEVIVHLMAHSKEKTLLQRVVEALSLVKGAFSLVFLSEKELIGARDPYGFRPLSLGRLKEAWVLASETCAFDLIGAEYVREIEPGEVVVINQQGVTSFSPFPPTRKAFCVFEYVYFSRPDSQIFGHDVYPIRKKMGYQLAREAGVPADIVIPVPDSGIAAALGYADGSRLPYEYGLVRNHYVGRTFIEPKESIRHFGVKIKLNAVRKVLEGKRVVVVDDSIVRGTTSRKIIKMLRQAGAKEVHLRISSPPIISPCYYGIDTPTKKELIASSHAVEEVRRFITADSLAHLSLEGMLAATGLSPEKFCTACFSEDYPIPFTDEERQQLGLFDHLK